MSTNEKIISQLKDEVQAYKARLDRLLIKPICPAEPLSRRDRFAMAAMQGILAHEGVKYRAGGYTTGANTAEINRKAIEQADALIKQLDMESNDE